jgi:hypothetical protein
LSSLQKTEEEEEEEEEDVFNRLGGGGKIRFISLLFCAHASMCMCVRACVCVEVAGGGVGVTRYEKRSSSGKHFEGLYLLKMSKLSLINRCCDSKEICLLTAEEVCLYLII